MNEQKFTQKSLEVIRNAQSLAVDNSSMQIEQEHLLYALLSQDNGLISELIKKMGINIDSITREVKKVMEGLPGVSGPGREPDKVYVSQDVDKALSSAEKNATKMKDEYVSVEHIFIGLLENPNSHLSEIFRTFNITKESF